MRGFEVERFKTARIGRRKRGGQLRASLDYGTIDEITGTGMHDYIDQLQSKLNALGAAIFETHVLYADLTKVSTPTLAQHIVPPGAWHTGLDIQVRQQQQ